MHSGVGQQQQSWSGDGEGEKQVAEVVFLTAGSEEGNGGEWGT